MRFATKLQSPDGHPHPQVHCLFPLRIASNHQVRVGPDFRFASDVPDAEAIAVIEVASNEGIEVSGVVVRPAQVTWDIRGYDIRNTIEAYAVVKKGKQSRLQAEFAFNARIKAERGELAASAGQSQIGGMIYVF
jgi:hypothetical protein